MLTLQGKIVDKITRNPLPFATVKIIEKKTGAIADDNGLFTINGLCKGGFHLEASFVGYETVSIFTEIKRDTFLIFELVQHNQLLSEVTVHGDLDENKTQISQVIGSEKITEEGNKTLSDLLESVAGVSVIRNGSGITKPIIHGMYGNRVSVLNNGVVQAGQQWGNDHAPEIDPYVADHIAVVKGAAALEYNGSTLGGVILIEPNRISNDPHLHGKANYIFQTNGLGNTLNTQLEKYGAWAAWRFTGTLKGIGDTQAPDYYLTNTGRREANAALQLEKQFSSKWFGSAYYSFFNTNLGILRGSQVGNLTDLALAINREVPYFTKDQFSYSIEAPRQLVNHQLLKVEGNYFITPQKTLTLMYAGQLNQRKEFDVRRSGRSDIPAMSMRLSSHLIQSTYSSSFSSALELKIGLQMNYKFNFNDNATTGILPLIPQYQQFQSGIFGILNYRVGKLIWEGGVRYDFIYLDASPIIVEPNGNKYIEQIQTPFNNLTINGGLKMISSKYFTSTLSMGYAQRAPEVNELYSYGLHQGVSGIEQGDRNLKKERSLKSLLTLEWASKTVALQTTGYLQRINDYMYLQPRNEFEETIRGAFPVFIYEQTDALIYGADINLSINPISFFKMNVAYAIVRGEDRTQDIPLVYMPADNLTASISVLPKDSKKLSHTSIGVSTRYVWEQTRLLLQQDFLAPPPAYFLLGFNASTSFGLKKNKLSINLRVENMLNTTYRDYLNRLRYFADEMGVNVSIGFNYSF